VLWEESKIDRNKSKSKMNFTQVLIYRKPCESRKSVKETTKNSKNNSYSENIMKMSYNIVSVMKDYINA